ncbi:thiamine diphosphokinase [Bacteroidota bacterium]
MKKCIVFANGKPPRKNVISFLQKAGYSTLICADGGANYAYKLGLIPDYIIGDFDSIKDSVLRHYQNKSTIIKYIRQSDTDVEKCLKFSIRKKFKDVILVGVTGDRLDHSFCNLGIVLKFSDNINVKVLHEKSLLQIMTGDITFNTTPGETVSIYGFNSKTKITSQGLKYPLKNMSLPFGERESTSNIAISNNVELKIRNGNVFVIREYEILKKNGFFQ